MLFGMAFAMVNIHCKINEIKLYTVGLAIVELVDFKVLCAYLGHLK